MTSRIAFAALLAAVALVATGCPEEKPGNQDTGPVIGADRVEVEPPDAQVIPTDGSVVGADATTTEPSDATTVEPSDATTTEPSDATTTEPSDATTVEPSDATTVEPSDATTVTPADATVVQPDGGTVVTGDGGTVAQPDAGSGGTAVIEHCNDNLPVPPAGQSCTVTAGTNAKVLITGTILTPGKVFRGGQVLVGTDGKIACVDCDCSLGAAGAATVVCPDAVVSPGLINTHDHIPYAVTGPKPTNERYEQRHDWRHGLRGHTKISTSSTPSGGTTTAQAIAWSELRFLVGGATSSVSSGSANGFLRNLDDANNQEGLGQPAADFETFPLGDGSFDGQPTSGCSAYPSIKAGSVDAWLPHIGEGIDDVAHNEMLCTESTANNGKDVINDKTGVIHGVAVLSGDVDLFAQDRAKLIWSPRSNVSLYGATAPVTLYARLGATIALGTDWLPSGSMNMLRELQCAALLNDSYYGHFFSDEQLWAMVTANAALTCAMDDAIGTLKPGLVADVSIFAKNGHEDYRAVIDAEPKHVLLVLQGGKALYGDSAVVSALATGCEDLSVCTVAKKVCAAGTGTTLAALTTANSSYYPLFFCGAPTNEPTCVPMRNDASRGATYTGQITADDLDGDGVLNATDNCPTVFNPVRPMDADGKQADADADGVGDVCDPCPLNANTTTCAHIDPNDLDGDGVPNVSDNCPTIANPGVPAGNPQPDADTDGKGDACDPCPNAANPGSLACPASIYDIKKGVVAPGSSAYVTNAIVTAVAPKFFYLQVKNGDSGYQGEDHSGILVYVNAAHPVLRGDRVSVSGMVTDFFGQIEMEKPTEITVLASSGEALPSPVEVTPSQIRTNGTRAKALDSVLVQVRNVTVASLTPTLDPGDTSSPWDFSVTAAGSTDELLVHDYLFHMPTRPAVGTTLASIAGVLHFDRNNYKLEPRDVNDIVESAPRLASITPATGAKIYANSTNSPTFTTPVQVSLDKPAIGNTDVTVTTSSANLTVHGTVTVLNGQSTAVVSFDSLGATPGVTVTATLGADTFSATVDVVDYVAVSTLTLAPATATVSPTGTLDLTLTSNVPAPPGGLAVDLAITQDAGVGCTLSATQVTIPANQTSVHFNLVAGTVESSSVVVKATAGAVVSNGAAITVQVVHPTTLTLAPATGTVAPNGKLAMTVTTDVNVYQALTVTLTVGTGGSAPGTVTIAAGAKSATFDFTAGAAELPEVTVDASATVPAGPLASNTAKIEIKTPVSTCTPELVISQVYGGGGASTATSFKNDYIELHNRSATATITLDGWSVQYGSATGTTWALGKLSGSVPPGGYFLVNTGSSNSAAGSPDVPADLVLSTTTGTLNLSASNGKIALVNGITALTGANPTGGALVDLVGYGTANGHEGATAVGALSNTTAGLRKGDGCADTNANDADFDVGTPAPRNATTAAVLCTCP
ncbi:MAG: thrombospondin type 3 repeat-containing protein [Myxococcales bacterium]